MLQRLSIRGKILAVVAVPVFVLILTAGFVVWTSVTQVTRTNNTAQLMEVVNGTQAFNAALRDEADTATNYLDAWAEHNDELLAQVRTLDDAIRELETMAATDPVAAEAYAAVTQILQGGQTLDNLGTALSLEEARAVRPEEPEDGGPLVWPTPEETALVAASYAVMSEEVLAYANTLPSDSPVKTTVTSISAYLTQEGNRANLLLTEGPAFQEDFIAAQESVDAAWVPLSAAIHEVEGLPENANVVTALAEVEGSMGDLAQRRADVLDRVVGASPTNTYYFENTEKLADVVSEVSLIASDPRLSRQLEAYVATDMLLDEMASEDTRVDQILRAQAFGTGVAAAIRTQFSRTDFVREQAQDALANLGEKFELPDAGSTFEQGTQSGYETVRNRVSDTTGTQLATAARGDWPAQVQEEVDVIMPFNDDTLGMAEDTAAENQRTAVLQATGTVIGSILIVLASVFLALLIARRIVNPLRRLTTTATAVRQELPRLVERVALPGERVDVSEVQIPVESGDEIGRLAEAFNAVNASTLAIASEQAALRGSISEMFVNVARRDQVLLNRQLSAIDEMERTEDNAGTLTRLFALDHLATRMRRNSESLLVLAGIDTGRRLRRPMPLSDVIRTASSEIELYERVQLELDTDPAMVGHSALTAAHLFAELLENATVFSDPGTPVVVRTEEEANSYIVRITDSGIGMTPEELAEANSRVASSAASEILGAQRLGLFVVGRIARRIGARVEITSHEGEGTVATVTMPPSLFDSSATSTDTSHVSGSAMDEEMHAPSALVSHDMRDEVLDTSSSVASAAERAGTAALGLANYQPAAIESGSSLAGRTAVSAGVAALLASDALNAPAAEEVDLEALTDGVSETGLPTRRRSTPTGPETSQETDSIIALPARATDAQLSALEADANSGFTPVVSASEVAPQTAEQRASMFRGFRARREAGDESELLAPDAESLGQAVRRGAAVLPEDTGLDRESGDAAGIVFDEDAKEPVEAKQSPLITSGYDHEDVEPSATTFDVPTLDVAGERVPTGAIAAMLIPTFADDDVDVDVSTAAADDDGMAYVAELEPELAPDAQPSGVASVSLDDPTAYGPPVPEPHAAADHGAAPLVAAGIAAHAVQSDPSPLTSSPSLDELIQGGSLPQERGGFFSKLFRKSKNEPAAPSAVTAMLASMPKPAPITPEPEPTPSGSIPGLAGAAVVATAASGGFAPEATDDTAPNAYAPEPADFASLYNAPAPAPADAWIGGGAPYEGTPSSLTPEASSAPYNPGSLGGGDGQFYSRDELAKPLGWETAGASALQAAAPDRASGYMPVVQLDEQPIVDEGDMASAAFSELSSLTAERPKVERTRAGLQKRRASDAPEPVVVPIADEIEIVHVDRDPSEVGSRFASFYSGTQRARSDVEAFERSTLGTLSES